MSSIMSIIFWTFVSAAAILSAVIAIYMVLGLVLVQNLRQCDSGYKVLQRQAQFLAQGVSPTISFDLEEYSVSDSSQSVAEPELLSDGRKSVARAEVNKQQTTSKVYGAVLQ